MVANLSPEYVILYTSSMEIRNATAADLEAIINLGEALQNESKDYEPLLVYNREESLKHYTAELDNKNAKIIVAIDDRKIVGYQYAYVTVLDYLSKNNRQCTLEAIYVLPDYRGRGIAKSLITSSEQWAIQEKYVDRIQAGIYAGNAASEIAHEKVGYKAYYTEFVKYINSNG
jgi:GNAT superfamily N-acetyltransferase